MIHICFVCNKEFDEAPYFIMEGRTAQPICSKYCLDIWYNRGW